MSEDQPIDGEPATEFDETLEEHERCMDLVSDLEHWVSSSAPPDEHWIGEVSTRIRTLSEALTGHFRGEEQTALYRELPIEFPRFAARLEKLKSEHEPMLGDMKDARQTLDRLGGAESETISALKARLRLLIATLRRHEAEENEIIMSAYWDDLGGSD